MQIATRRVLYKAFCSPNLIIKNNSFRFATAAKNMATGKRPEPNAFLNDPRPSDVVSYEEPYPRRGKILNNVLEAVGHTPLIRLNKIPQSFGVKAEILVKCEYFNPGGSIKDRIVMRMVNDAEKQGKLQPGGTLIEPSSGNTAIGLGLVAALKGYKAVVTIPDKNAGEKLTMMKALGIDIVKTPSSVAYNDPRSYFEVAKKMSSETPNSLTLNQYDNISNPLANYDQTGIEILEDCDYKIDAVVIGTGTGGTLTGIGAKIKENVPTCKVVAVDPYGSIMAEPPEINTGVAPYKVEGLGHDYVPNTLVRKYVDHWVKSNDKDSFDLARRMIKEEGLLIGASCGSMLYGAIKYALDHNLDESHRIVVVLPDSTRNYMSKFASDDWMIDLGFMPLDTYLNPDHKLYGKTVKQLKLKTIQTYTRDLTVKEAIEVFKTGEEAIVLEKNGKIEGAIYGPDLLTQVYESLVKETDNLSQLNVKLVPSVSADTDLSIVAKLLERHKIVVSPKSADNKTLHKITPLDLFSLNI